VREAAVSDFEPGRPGPVWAEAGVFLLPFALPEPIEDLQVDAEVLARRLPDLLHQLLNAGRPGPAGLLEIHSPPNDGPTRWVTLSEVPSPDEVVAMFGGGAMRALVSGWLRGDGDALAVELSVHFAAADGSVEGFGHAVHARIGSEDPATGVLHLVERLAAVLEVPFRARSGRLLTRVPRAFFRYLEGLDGAALLTGDPDLESERRGEELLRPLADALAADPGFGLALRTLADALFPALGSARVSRAACLRVLDRTLAAGPTDGIGCTSIAEQLAAIGEDRRARVWLERAVALEDPPPRAFEALGVLVANQGDRAAARALWERGLAVDGHPDFLAHLARLAFTEQRPADGWDAMRRGLWRKQERLARAAEWDERSAGCVLLRYLHEHLDGGEPPDDVIESVEELAGALEDPVERVDLGLCLRAIHRDDLAEPELRAGLAGDLPADVEDRAARALLGIEVPDFERRFAAARERAERGRDPRSVLVEMQACLERQPLFWPALFYSGVALRRLGHDEQALDLMNEVVQRRPGEVEALVEMAEMFDARGNPKRALECVDGALELRPGEAELHVLRAQCLEHLGRAEEAGRALDRAIELEPRRRRRRRQG
jgi:tetratricopeptide (TPR) repeat protein